MSHKVLTQGVDFDLTYNPLRHLGYKAVLSVIGEIYSKFYKPSSLSVIMAISNRLGYDQVQELWKGVLAACDDHKIKSLSLDLIPSTTGVTISLTATGWRKKTIKPAEPKSMDLICLTGDLGAAYMGLNVLEREKIAFNTQAEQGVKDIKQPDLSKYKYILESYLSPFINNNLISRFEEADILPLNGYFITKGLAYAVKQLSKDTGLGAKIYIDKIPISSNTFAMSEEINIDAVTAALNGGDDYKFIFVIPIDKAEQFRHDFQDFDIIGHLAQPEVGSVILTPQGVEMELKAQGW